jgi:hypothetical protein
MGAMKSLRRLWPVLALLAGVLLAYFEIHRAGGVTADNVFWVLIAGLIVVMSLIDLFQKRPGPPGGDEEPPPPNLGV